MVRKRQFAVWFAAGALSLAAVGCASNPVAGLMVTRSAKEREVGAIRADYEAKAVAARATQDAATKVLLAAKDAQLVGAANAFFSQDYVFKTIPVPVRTDLVVHNLALEGWAATGQLMPDYPTMQVIQKRLAKDLDETRTSLTDLQVSHAAAMAENQALADQAKAHAAALAAATEQVQRVAREGAERLAAKQAELIAVQSDLVAATKASADQAKARQAQLSKLSWGAGILAALCLAGAIVSPVMKGELGLGAAVLGGAAVTIPMLEPWWILTGVGLGVTGIVVWVLVKYHKGDRLGDALALSVQDLRDKGGDIAAATEATVADRLARYRKTKAGTIKAERDPALEAHLDERLAAFDHLPAKTPP